MTSFVTQCPHCRTSFRVNPAQLGAAQGMVRCGACHEVFNAGRYLQADGRARPGASAVDDAPAPPLADVPPDQGQALNDEHLDLDHIDLDAELARLEQQERLKPLPAPPRPVRQEPMLGRLDEPADDAAPALPADQPARASEAGSVRLTPVDDNSPLPPSPLAVSERPLRSAARHAQRREPAIDPSPLRSEPALTDAPLFELDDEPLQLDWQPTRPRWGRRLGWLGLNLLALLALLGQYVIYNFDELARQDAYRPWLERLCPTLGCTLPARVDITQIRSTNLVVRSHPDFTGALVVDAILYNRAPFAQPFPLLELRFADLSGRLVASRQFKPSEYLAGELAGEREMPPQTPIHIALDILDPGEQAVNYSLNFRSPE